MSCICHCHASSQKWLRGAADLLVCMQTAVSMQAIKDVQSGTRILYVICAEGKANKNITIANLVSLQSCRLVAIGACGIESHLVLPYQVPCITCFTSACYILTFRAHTVCMLTLLSNMAQSTKTAIAWKSVNTCAYPQSVQAATMSAYLHMQPGLLHSSSSSGEK